MSNDAPLWLDGVNVLDLSAMLPGPFATMLLGDMGAEVVKIERHWGADYARGVEPRVDDMSAYFAALNRNKRSLVLNLDREGGDEVFADLIEWADVLVESFRPGALDDLGADWESVRAIDPEIVYCSISGYGQDGPDTQRAGHDLNYMARAGLLDQNGRFEGDPVVPGFQVADVAGGLYAALNIMGALLHRERHDDAGGQHLDVSLTESALSLHLPMLAGIDAGASDERGTGLLGGGSPLYNVYRTADDRHLAVAPLEPHFASTFLEVLRDIEALDNDVIDDVFSDAYEMGEPGESRHAMAEIIERRTLEEWMELFEGRDVCCEPVQSPEDVLEDQLFEARDVFFELAGVRHGRTPVTPEARAHSPAPEMGEHTDEILSSLGYSEEEVERLRESEVV
jgi:crotonobetainyl-CoA:carnitine CoA-transferase CaiB-like acyl-CoA transferase